MGFTKLFYAVVAMTAIETYCEANWIVPYFTKGIRFRFGQARLDDTQLGALERLSEHEYKKPYHPRIILRKIAWNQVAIRERLFDFSWNSGSKIIHGYLSFDRGAKTYSVYGVVNYTALLVFGIFLFAGFKMAEEADVRLFALLFTLVFVPVFCVVLALKQMDRYNEAITDALEKTKTTNHPTQPTAKGGV